MKNANKLESSLDCQIVKFLCIMYFHILDLIKIIRHDIIIYISWDYTLFEN